MKKILISLILVSVVTTIACASQFCSGYNAGYATGYQQASGSSLPPAVPLCPLQPSKKLNDPWSDFEHGYVIGYNDGYAAGSG